MASKANHHFIPQFYLRGFAEGTGRQARVFTFDHESKKSFTTLVRNVGSRRYFNRIEVDGTDPNALEDGFADLESEFAVHLNEVIDARTFPSEEHFASMINLMAQMSARNPRLRSILEGFHKRVFGGIAGILFNDRNIWETQMKKMKEEGIPIKDISFEEMKEFHERGEYELVINQTHLIGMELKMLDPIIECLANRNWCFISADADSQFISSDDPVVLSWTDRRQNRGAYSPGHGLPGTTITFPVCSDLVLLGTFEELDESASYSANQVAYTNSHVANFCTKQIYARDGEFALISQSGATVKGKRL